MLDNFDGYDYTQPLDYYPNPYQPEPAQAKEEGSNRLLETAIRYGAFFSLGVSLTLFVRLFGQLQPLFWLAAIAALAGLGFAIHLTRRVELLAIALIVAAALVAGHWDWLAHGAQQVTEVVNQ